MSSGTKLTKFSTTSQSTTEDAFTSALRESTALELRLQDEVLVLKKKINHQENDFKKDKALLEQKIELLNLHSQEYQKREENLKRMNETILNSLNDIASQGSSSKIFKEIQLNYEQHNKELIEGRARLQQTIISLEGETRELKDEINRNRLSIKDLEIALEKERINNERALEVNFLDRTQMENDIQKHQLITEEGFQQTRFNLESRIQEISFANEQSLQKQRDVYEEKIKQMSIAWDKEKSAFEQRIQKNLNTIKKYQSHIESQQNLSLNTSTLANQSRIDISNISKFQDLETDLRAEIVRLSSEKNKSQIELQQSQSMNAIKEEKIEFLHLKNSEYVKTIEDLRERISLLEISSTSSQQQISSQASASRTKDSPDQSPIKAKQNQLRLQRSISTNIFNKGIQTTQAGNGQQILQPFSTQTNQEQSQSQFLPLESSSNIGYEQLNRSQVKQRISNLIAINHQSQQESDGNIYQPLSFQGQGDYQQCNGLGETDSLENLAIMGGTSGNDNNQSHFNLQIQKNQQTSPHLYAPQNSAYKQLQTEFISDNSHPSSHLSVIHYTQSTQRFQSQQSPKGHSQQFEMEQNRYQQQYQQFQPHHEQQQTRQLSQQQGYTQPYFQQIQNLKYNNQERDRIEFDPEGTDQQTLQQNIDECDYPLQMPLTGNRVSAFNPSNDSNDVVKRNRTKSSSNNQQEQQFIQKQQQIQRVSTNTSSSLGLGNFQQYEQGQQIYSADNRRSPSSTSHTQSRPPIISYNEQRQGSRALNNITNQSQYLSKSCSNNHLVNNYKTLLLCENCGQCFIPSELVDHMALCDPSMQGISISTKQNDESVLSEPFQKVIGQLNYEKQLVEQKLSILESHLKNSNNMSGSVAQDRDRLRQELDQIKLVLGKANMNHVVQTEEQEACNTALKNEITFLIKKLLKAKGQLQENCNTTQKSIDNISYFEGSRLEQSPYSVTIKESTNSANKAQNKKDYSNFSIKGCVDYNSYSNSNYSLPSQGIIESSLLRDSISKQVQSNEYQDLPRQQFLSKKSTPMIKHNNKSTSNLSQHSYY